MLKNDRFLVLENDRFLVLENDRFLVLENDRRPDGKTWISMALGGDIGMQLIMCARIHVRSSDSWQSRGEAAGRCSTKSSMKELKFRSMP